MLEIHNNNRLYLPLAWHEAAQGLLNQTVAPCHYEQIHFEFLLDAEKTFSKRIRSMINIDHSRPFNELNRKVDQLKNTPVRG